MQTHTHSYITKYTHTHTHTGSFVHWWASHTHNHTRTHTTLHLTTLHTHTLKQSLTHSLSLWLRHSHTQILADKHRRWRPWCDLADLIQSFVELLDSIASVCVCLYYCVCCCVLLCVFVLDIGNGQK